jgi:pimeloyl-ACP methyl ester carboxylesterase
MSRILYYFLRSLVLLTLIAAPAAAQPSIEGDWQGALAAGGANLRLAFHVKSTDGKLTATLDSIDQGAMAIPFDSVTITGDTVKLEMKVASASFEGRLSTDGSMIDGTWTQGGVPRPLVLKRGAAVITALRRPQVPVKPYLYLEEEVSYQNKAAGVTLAGTLTLPRATAPVPAVVLISGSGPEDRDETIFGHKPFLILADHLTRNGIAVLRLDDRGVGGSTGKVDDSTSEDFADDAIAGIAYLKGRKEIDPKRIGLVGHSEGGLIGPIAATRSPDVAFVVMMAGPGLTGEEILYLQAAAIMKANGASEEQIAANRTIQERILAIAKSEKDPAAARAKFAPVRADFVAAVPPAQQQAAAAVLNAQFERVITPWFRYFLTFDPRPTLAKVKCPVLALIGERDLQVPYVENLDAIAAAFKTGGNTNATLAHLPGLNHLFQTATTGSPSEYMSIEETMSPVALKTISDWILQTTNPR